MSMEKPGRRAERVLLYGAAKAGKSFAWVDVLYHLWRYDETGARMFLLDTDRSWDATLDHPLPHSKGMTYGDLEDQGLIVVHEPHDFRTAHEAAKAIFAEAKRDDWVVVDMLEDLWEWAQLFYTEGVTEEDPVNYFVQMRREVKAREAQGKGHKAQFGGQEGTDWQFITSVYKEVEIPLTKKTRANTIGVTGSKTLDENRGATNSQISMTKHVGKEWPAGQKGITHRYNTVIRVSKRNDGTRDFTMVGDRLREDRWAKELDGKRTLKVEDTPIHRKGFVRMYLGRIAGWEFHKKETK